jgi:hypothetical protein
MAAGRWKIVWIPNYVSSDNDPLDRFRQWQAKLRILEVTEIKFTVYAPWLPTRSGRRIAQ